ncbi:hypothetical protein AN216_17200 [Streptomyces oceani]|uniref:Pyruvate carboxyltransferase domain-containing protein n=2 Tax=Streptomyces oceani TaxID=1075402 RepID=A0A1E7JZB3_9ACTN|nr:hypothetical protein AN216_17200 [Streptomyces oceani]
MQFVRIGVDITDVSPAEEFIPLAKELGLTAFVNLMKTNVLETEDVVDPVRQCVSYGADSVYLVDSAGSYLPFEVSELFHVVSDTVDVPLGFHGHDNLGLANANALAAASSGAHYIDATLDGIGRGAGNTSTEGFATVLHRQGAPTAPDYQRLAHLSESTIRVVPRLHDDRIYQVVGGLTRTHSSLFPLITRCAEAEGVDVFSLMAAVAEVDRVHPTEKLVAATASALAAS